MVCQPSSVRHQGNPLSSKDLRIGLRYCPKIKAIHKADGSLCRTVARNSLKPAKKDREQEILLFPVLHPSPVPQPLPHEQRRGPSASEKPSMSPALSSSPIKVFGKDGGSLRGEGNLLCASQKVPFPPHKTSTAAYPRASRAHNARRAASCSAFLQLVPVAVNCCPEGRETCTVKCRACSGPSQARVV